MPHDELIEQRTINKKDVDEHLKQANSFKQLPELSECKYREYIVIFLMRHYYVRNQDLMFDIVYTKRLKLWLTGAKITCGLIRANNV